jgi:hypothetical protein
VYDAASHVDAKLSSVLVDKQWVWRPARSEDLVSIQSFLPSIQISDFNKPSWMLSKSGSITHLKLGKQLDSNYQ